MGRLDDFRIGIMKHLALVDDFESDVCDADDSIPIVATLGDELLTVLANRISSVGGSAAVFILKDGGFVRAASAIDAECLLRPEGIEGITIPGDEESTVSMFFDYLVSQPDGVRLGVDGVCPRVEDIHQVDLAQV